MTTTMTSQEIKQTITNSMEQALKDLATLVQCQSVASGTSSEEKAGMVAARVATKTVLERAGFTTREIVLPSGNNAIFGEIPASSHDKPVVLLYAHYDVQPGWGEGSFMLTLKDGRYYGRGASDDKSGILIHALAVSALKDSLGIGVKVVVEGEEETGIGSLEAYVANDKTGMFQSDAIIVADTGNWKVGEPTLTTALRGIVVVTVKMSTLQRRVHSGLFGGPAPDALMALIRTLATLQDEQGNVTIDELTSDPWHGSNPLTEEVFRQQAGVLPEVDLTGKGTIGDRLWAGYAVNVVGMDVPAIKGATNALIESASARVSLRVPPDKDPQEALDKLKQHLRSRRPWHADISFSDEGSGEGYSASTDNDIYRAAEWALQQAYGKSTTIIGAGGSIPLINVFAQHIPQANILLWGTEEPQANIHGTDESLDPDELKNIAIAEALFLYKLGGGS
ncbi:dipeptidase [Reticulibacter mediterranei]|uniref:Dipeptidase n=1 Tax=Reticulibacter mediterranei TaxID=2778369 RepID=A0A8J3N740_9CHLR|nr:M20/M25/M40 family metallo-hydrolase [Reticulibacter mediterranei]GHP01048.1 dipeptidase [Reticulibacter mediterranei]